MPAQTTVTIFKPLVPDPHSTPVTHGADWVAPFPPVVDIFLLFPQIPSYSPFTSPLFFPSFRARKLGAIIIIIHAIFSLSTALTYFIYLLSEIIFIIYTSAHILSLLYRDCQNLFTLLLTLFLYSIDTFNFFSLYFQQARAEQEEEYISNTLLKKIQTLKKEKESLALNYEQEEECLTNDLSRKLNQVNLSKLYIYRY